MRLSTRLPAQNFVFRRLTLIMSCLAMSVADAADDHNLAARLLPLIEQHEGDVAVSVRHLVSHEEFHHRCDVTMPTASLIKLPVMIEAYRQAESGAVDLDARITLTEQDKVPGSGILTPHFSAGTQLSLRDAVRLMIAWSDNTATNLVVDQIGLRSTADTMERLGYPETKLNSKVYRGSTSVWPERSQQYGLGSTTSADMVSLLHRLHAGDLASADACAEMVDHLRKCEDRLKLPRFLPEQVKLAHKTGSVSRTRCAAGLMFLSDGPVALCVLTTNNTDLSWGSDNAADVLCGRIARAVFDHFNPGGTNGGLRPTLQTGDFGEMVEAVQRTLNARTQPSVELSVDGDFGPATQSAVAQFQRQHGLAETGIVDTAVWKALSPLQLTEADVPPPAVVNSAELPLQDPDPLDGPPIVSCRAWAIADGESGELLWQHDADRQLAFASTTKMMTAYVVLQMAQEQPALLDETVTFSHAADATRGSTSGLREGESLTVRELLYGLMLPSGNDAAIALAEHFGPRLTDGPDPPSTGSDSSGQPKIDPVQQFVSEMNRTAEALQMTATHYTNPHGLSQNEHLSSARDLTILARNALTNSDFRHYVTTRQHGTTVDGPGGYQRNVLWKNSNRLLETEGYSGVKTGTTGDAGACLVSAGTRDGRQLIIVVLGSTSSTGRYVDARNLYRWAWKNLAREESLSGH